jgi:photosynthetic reaction center cytochrome c subunit
MNKEETRNFFSPQLRNMAGWLLVTGILLSASLWVLGFIYNRVAVATEEQTRTTAQYVNYWVSNGYISSESNTAIQAYILEHPEPQNVQVLTGLQTAEIWQYMTTFVAGGLQVDCTHCHVLGNFGAETIEEYEALGGTRQQWVNKKKGRAMLQMTADLNQNWLPRVEDASLWADWQVTADGTPTNAAEIMPKQRSGAQIICATCHLGQPQFETWPAEIHAAPNDYRLPIDDRNGDGVANVDDINHMLVVTGKDDEYSLDTVQYNQYTMIHMNNSLGIGCTHCHNARYFPSNEQPAKFYAYQMLQMTQYLQHEWGTVEVDGEPIMANKDMSCLMCHRNQVRPPGAARSESVLPPPLTTSYVGE